MQLVIGNTYESAFGFGRLLYLGETHDIDGYLPTFRTSIGERKFYSYDELPKALVEFATPTVSRADELIACLEGEIAKRDARIVELKNQAFKRDGRARERDTEILGLHAELAAIKAQGKECPASKSVKAVEVSHPSFGVVDYARDAAPVSEAKARGVVQWPEADEIMQMAFEEGQPADDASGYCFELEEFDLFIERLMSEVANLNAAPVQQVSVPDGNVCVPIEVLRLYEFMASSFTPFTSQHEQIAISLRKAKAAMLAAAPAAPAADAGVTGHD